MNRWQQSVVEVQARKKQLSECERAQAALSKVTACLQQMVSSLGSSVDGSCLREEMEETRILTHRISKGLHRRMLALLVETEQEDKEQVERLWVRFLSSTEHLQQHLRKSGTLLEMFPLSQRTDRRALVSSGLAGGGADTAARAAAAHTPWEVLEERAGPDLEKHLTEVDALLEELLQKANVPLWSVKPSQEAWVEEEGQEEEEQSLEEMMMQVEVVPGSVTSGCCHHQRCRLGCLLCLLS